MQRFGPDGNFFSVEQRRRICPWLVSHGMMESTYSCIISVVETLVVYHLQGETGWSAVCANEN